MIDIIDNSQFNYSTSSTHQRTVTGAHLSITNQSGENNGSFAGDQVSFSYFKVEESYTYSSAGSIQSATDAAYDLLRSFVIDTFEKQGMDFTLSIGGDEVDLRELTQQDAQELVAVDGYFGVEQTSDRIVDFATGIAGNDPTRLEAILEGVERGFNEALEAFGGWLPDISYQTYDAVMEKLDVWASETQTG